MRATLAGRSSTRVRLVRLGAAAGLVAVSLVGATVAPADATITSHVASATKAPTLMPVKGFTYVTAPSEFQSFVKMIKATGYITGATIKGAKNGKSIQTIVLLAQYNPKITKSLDKASLKKVLDSATSGLAAAAGTKAVKDYAVAGTHVRTVDLTGMTVAVTYIKTGKLLELFGPNANTTLKFAKLYLASAKAHGQKLG